MLGSEVDELERNAHDYALVVIPHKVGLSWEAEFKSHDGRIIGKAKTYMEGWKIMRNYYDRVK